MPDHRDVGRFLDTMDDVITSWHSSRDSMRWRPDSETGLREADSSDRSYWWPGRCGGVRFAEVDFTQAGEALRAASLSMSDVTEGFEHWMAEIAANQSTLALATLANWHTAQRGWRDVLRCLVGQHRGVTVAEVRGALYARCSCGAICRDGGPWFEGKPFTRRKGWR